MQPNQLPGNPRMTDRQPQQLNNLREMLRELREAVLPALITTEALIIATTEEPQEIQFTDILQRFAAVIVTALTISGLITAVTREPEPVQGAFFIRIVPVPEPPQEPEPEPRT